VTTIVGALRVAQDKALLLQVGAFSRAQDPVGVVNAYRLVKKHYDVRLVLAGTAGDDRESLEVLADLRQAAHHDPDIVVLELPPEAHLQINALQRAATIVLQKSVRAGLARPGTMTDVAVNTDPAGRVATVDDDVQRLGSRPIVLALLTYNNAATVPGIAQTGYRGLSRAFPDVPLAIVNADSGSSDGTT